MVGPLKWSTNLLRQTFGERYLTASIFLTNSRLCRSYSRQFRHKKCSRNLRVVITYPLIQETFAFVESNLECEICRQISEFDSVRNKSEKGIAKKVSFTIMRFPRWTIDCHTRVFDQRPVGWSFEGLVKLTYSRNVAQKTFNERSQVVIGAWLRAVVAQGNLGGSSPKK